MVRHDVQNRLEALILPNEEPLSVLTASPDSKFPPDLK